MEPLIEPLITEPRGDDEQNYVELRAFDLPGAYYDVAVTLTLELDGLSTELPMVFHIEGGPGHVDGSGGGGARRGLALDRVSRLEVT